MREKKTPRTWYLAITHFLTSWLIIPFLFGVIFLLITSVPSVSEVVAGNLFLVLSQAVGIIGIWVGTIYSSKFIHHRYNIQEPQKVLLLSSSLAAILALISVLFFFISEDAVFTDVLISAAAEIVAVSVFYYVSKKEFLRLPQLSQV